MPPDLLHTTLETNYAFGKVKDAHVLPSGPYNRVLRVDTETSSFVLRISQHAVASPDRVIYEHELMQFMNTRFAEVPAPISTREGETFFCYEGKISSLFPLMPGDRADKKREAVRLEAARMLARLHQAALEYPATGPESGYPALKDLNWQHNHAWNWSQLQCLLSPDHNISREAMKNVAPNSQEEARRFVHGLGERCTVIAEEKDALSAWIAELAASSRSLLTAPIHGDYFCNNLLVENDCITAVIDWDECRPEWLVYELARAIWEFCDNQALHTLDCERAIQFLRIYSDAGGPVPPAEFDLIIPLIRCVRIEEILFELSEALHGAEWTEEHTEYTTHNLISLENLKKYNVGDLTSFIKS